MAKKEILILIAGIILLTGLFFYKTVFKGLVPFPGDALLAEFKPWQSTSYLGYAPGGIAHKAQYPDTLRQLYPWRTEAISQWKEGSTPLWNPHNFSGSPLLANFQSAALYPLNVLFWLTDHVSAWTILVLLQPLLAALFTYLFSRRIGLTQPGAGLSAISYGFSGFMAVWLEYNSVGHVILWLPFLLLCIEQLADKPKRHWQILFAAGHTMAILAGHPQVYAYMLAFTSIYALFRVRAAKPRITIGILTILGIAMAGAQIVPGAELLGYAARSAHEFTNLFEKILIQPWQLLALPFPNIFGNPATRTYWPDDTFVGKVTTIGLVPLFFVLSALRSKNKTAKFFLWAGAVVLVLITANPLTFLLYKLPLPFINSSSPTLMSFLLSFSLAVFLGSGLDVWIKEKHTLRKLAIRSAQVAVILGVIFLLQDKPVAHRALLYASALSAATLALWFVAIRRPKWKYVAIAALLIVHAADSFVFFNRFNPFVPPQIVFPDHEIASQLRTYGTQRFWGYGSAAITANFATQMGTYSPEGYDPLYPRWYGEFLHGSYDGKLLDTFDNATRSDAVIAPGFGEDGFATPARTKILNAASVRSILDRAENGSTATTFPPGAYETVYNQNDWRIIQNNGAAPRAFLTTQAIAYETREDFVEKFFSESFDPATQVLLPVMPELTYPLDTAGTAAISTYEDSAVTMTTSSNSPAVLVLTDTYYPGWKAWIDGNEAPVLRANWTFRAIPVPQGNHTVVMRYEPESFFIGKIISMIGVILLCVTVILF